MYARMHPGTGTRIVRHTRLSSWPRQGGPLFCGPWRIQHGLVQDMQKSGAPLAKICNAGPWRSNAVIRYLDECELEEDVALEAALHVEDEEWID